MPQSTTEGHDALVDNKHEQEPRAISASQIRRAAGGKDTAHLERLIQLGGGWTSQELDDMASQDGKGALHMAAWYGSLDNIKLLLDYGCNLNQIATGPYSYGKTPIFFATTRCRNDAVMLLLERGANVCIVNNKGQSVLSLASSHLKPETIQAVQQAEQQQDEWQNYRHSHSDGLQYGDLDPRFLSRPLEPTDVVTELAINPTTKSSRKGNFARNNPAEAREAKKQQKKRQRKKRVPSEPTPAELQEYKGAWEQVGHAIKANNSQEFAKALLVIVRFGQRQRRAWIAETAKLLQSMFTSAEDVADITDKLDTATSLGMSAREQSLIHKLLDVVRTTTTNKVDKPPLATQKKTATRLKTETKSQDVESETLSRIALDSVCGLSREVLFNPDRNTAHLSLPQSPVWIDSLDDLLRLERMLEQQSSTPAATVAMDTEWYTSTDDSVQISTLQLAWMTTPLSVVPNVFVVDVMKSCCDCVEAAGCGCNNDKQKYRSSLVNMMDWLFHKSGMIILGFAMGHDLSKLSSYLGKTVSTERCMDLQPILATKIMKSKNEDGNASKRQSSSLPGLKACCRHYFSGWELSKTQQCSDWARRPLEAEQLEYAGLDAAVLLVLLTELGAAATGIN